VSSESGWEICTGGDRKECRQEHFFHGVGYRHATTMEEVQKQLELGKTVRDYDADEVTEITKTQEDKHRYHYIDKSSGSTHSVFTGWPQNLLIQVDNAPVTDEELAEIARSIASVRTES
jgi:hypothetical protein